MPNGEHGDGKEYEGRTYLYIRTHPADNGTEPLPGGLSFWESPDIQIRQPGGAIGTEAIAGQQNEVLVTVTNAGGIQAVDAFVDVFFADPSTVITPATATLIGSGYLTVDGYSMKQSTFPWTPLAIDAGHRCLLARVALYLPPDAYVDGSIFDVIGDRHVAQRNIHVVALSQMQVIRFAFAAVNPRRERMRATLTARELRDERELAGLRAGLGCGFAQFGTAPLPELHLAEGKERGRYPDRANPMELIREPFRLVRTGVIDDDAVDLRGAEPRQAADNGLQLDLEPGEVRQAVLAVTPNRETRPGDLHAVAITQLDERGAPVGGLTVVVRH